MTKDRIFYLDVIKVIAMFMVVFNHCHLFINNSDDWLFIIHYILFFFSKTAVPLFLMISGALIIGKNDSYIKILKRIARVLIPFLLITVLWRVFDTYFHSMNNDFWPYWLWYLLALIAVYLFLPFINKMIVNMQDKDYKIFFLFFLIIPCIIFTFNMFYNIYIGENNSINNDFFINLIPLTIPYFVLGYYLKDKKISKKCKNISIIIMSVVLIILAILAFVFQQNDILYYQLDNYRNIFNLLMAPALFMIIKYFFENYRKKSEFSELIINLSNNSFDIYLWHVFVIEILIKTTFFKELLSFNSFEATLTLQIFTIVLLDIIFTILKHIPLLKNVLNNFFS